MTNFLNNITLANLLKWREQFTARLNEKHPHFVTGYYLFFLAIYISGTFIKGTTMAGHLITQHVIFLLLAIPAVFIVLKIALFDYHSLMELTVFALLECVLYNIGYHAGDFSLFYFIPFVYGAKDIDYRLVLKVFITVNVIGILIAMGLALGGVIRNYEGIRSLYSPMTRYGMGAVYPSDFAARGFCVLMAYAALRRFRFSLPEYISYAAIAIWYYTLTNTRLDMMLMLLLFLLIIFYNKEAKLLQRASNQLITLGMYIFIGIIFLMGLCYHPGSKLLGLVNTVLSGRLSYEQLTFQKYNIQLFGQFINQPGGGAYYIDSVFFRTIFMYGLVVFIMLLILILAMNRRLISAKAFCLEICFMLFILSGAIDQHFWDSSFNFILLSLFANLKSFNDAQPEIE